MKAPVLALIVAATAFGGTSIYFYNQMQDARARADEFAAKSTELNARIVELEKARAQFQERRFASANTFGGGAMMAGPGQPSPSAAAAKADAPDELHWNSQPLPERSPAMQKMMRSQVRALNKRLYADVGSQLGLSKDQANKLIDLLTDQQTQSFETRDSKGAGEARDQWQESQRQLESEITDLIGADKAMSLEEYQKTLPARQDVEMLSRQFDGIDAPLNDDQRKRLLSAIVEERERVPVPKYVEGTGVEEFQQTLLAWEEDYNQRLTSQAHRILNTDQATAFTEIQQARNEMRAQFSTPGRGPRPGMRGPGGSVMYTSAMPIGIAVTADVVSETPAPDKK
jgi:hypothetical protein